MNAQTTTKDKALEKIRKCLALSKSANEHEAAAALRQAQKMMSMHGFTDDDVGLIEFLSAQVITDYEFPQGKLKIRDGIPYIDAPTPRIIQSVVSVITHAMGVTACSEPQEKGNTTFIAIRYFGVRNRVIMAEHAHQVVYRAVGRAWQAYLEQNPQFKGRSGARAGFYFGWCSAVANKVEELVVSQHDRDKTKEKVAKHYGKKIDNAETSKRKVYSETLAAGVEASDEFEIRRPIDQSKMRIGFDK